MGGKTHIGETARKIKSGCCLFAGVKHKIKKGLTRVDGTLQDILFEEEYTGPVVSGQKWEFGYSPSTQTFTIPKNGTYRIELAGGGGGGAAGGGNGWYCDDGRGSYHYTGGGYGGGGGSSYNRTSDMHMTAGTKITMTVGKGGDGSSSNYNITDEHHTEFITDNGDRGSYTGKCWRANGGSGQPGGATTVNYGGTTITAYGGSGGNGSKGGLKGSTGVDGGDGGGFQDYNMGDSQSHNGSGGNGIGGASVLAGTAHVSKQYGMGGDGCGPGNGSSSAHSQAGQDGGVVITCVTLDP